MAFKEWALVCEALAAGRQCVLLRKGGIAEGGDGFRFEHAGFFLFPTRFHEQLGRTVLPPDTPLPEQTAGEIRISHFARVEWTHLVTDKARLPLLAPHHILAPDVVEERFGYSGSPGLNVAFVRVFRLSEPWVLEDLPQYGGCRSWVEIPDPPEPLAMSEVIEPARLEAMSAALRRELEG